MVGHIIKNITIHKIRFFIFHNYLNLSVCGAQALKVPFFDIPPPFELLGTQGSIGGGILRINVMNMYDMIICNVDFPTISPYFCSTVHH